MLGVTSLAVAKLQRAILTASANSLPVVMFEGPVEVKVPSSRRH